MTILLPRNDALMNAPPPELVSRRTRDSGGARPNRLWIAALVASVSLSHLAAAADFPVRFLRWDLDRDSQPIGRATLSSVAPEDSDDYEQPQAADEFDDLEQLNELGPTEESDDGAELDESSESDGSDDSDDEMSVSDAVDMSAMSDPPAAEESGEFVDVDELDTTAEFDGSEMLEDGERPEGDEQGESESIVETPSANDTEESFETADLTEPETVPLVDDASAVNEVTPVDTAGMAEEADDRDSSPKWLTERFLLTSASQEPPFLVPLPDPPLPPMVPPSPDDVVRSPLDPGRTEALPFSPQDSALGPLSPECESDSVFDESSLPPGACLIRVDEDCYGVGSRQVPFATFHIDPVQPLSQVRLRASASRGLTLPDRAERFWAAPPVGPAQPERRIDYQLFSVYTETGGDHFAAFTEVPLMTINPEVNDSTTGLGTITLGQKFLLSNPNNRRWQVAQILRTYLPTGSASRGLGNELVAMEPGCLFRYRFSEFTYLHGEVKYWIPIGGDPQFAGGVVQYGLGMSHVLWQSDDRALLSTMEMIGNTIGDGRATLPDGSTRAANGDTFVSMLPGVRVVLGPSGDLGLLELGLSGGMTFGDPGWFDSRALFDIRWSY
jgi:hypothetical protein